MYDIKSLYEFDKSLFALGDKLLRHNITVAGDFNAPDINPENHQFSGNVFKPTTPQTLFYLIIEILSAVLKSCLV